MKKVAKRCEKCKKPCKMEHFLVVDSCREYEPKEKK